MAGQNANKGNPASHRMSNANRKANRQARVLRGAKRRAERADEQRDRAAENRRRREAGGLTPWQTAQLARIERRARDPKVQERAARHAQEAKA